MKVTVKCPCGRKSSHQVVQEGQRAAALRCDAACVQAGRQQQLAGAFGVEDPAHHISSFDRNRSASILSDPAVSTDCDYGLCSNKRDVHAWCSDTQV